MPMGQWAAGGQGAQHLDDQLCFGQRRMDGKLHKGCSKYVWVKSCCSLLPMPSTFSPVDIQKVADWVKRLRFGSLNALSTPPANALAQSRKLIDCPFISVQRCRAADRSC